MSNFYKNTVLTVIALCLIWTCIKDLIIVPVDAQISAVSRVVIVGWDFTENYRSQRPGLPVTITGIGPVSYYGQAPFWQPIKVQEEKPPHRRRQRPLNPRNSTSRFFPFRRYCRRTADHRRPRRPRSRGWRGASLFCLLLRTLAVLYRRHYRSMARERTARQKRSSGTAWLVDQGPCPRPLPIC
jgi:hypothetical protein